MKNNDYVRYSHLAKIAFTIGFLYAIYSFIGYEFTNLKDQAYNEGLHQAVENCQPEVSYAPIKDYVKNDGNVVWKTTSIMEETQIPHEAIIRISTCHTSWSFEGKDVTQEGFPRLLVTQ